MMAHSIAVPASSRISTQLAGADFYDAYEALVQDADKTALEIYLDVVPVHKIIVPSMLVRSLNASRK